MAYLLNALHATFTWILTVLIASSVTGVVGRRVKVWHLPFVFQLTLLASTLIMIFENKVEIPLFKPSTLTMIGLAVVPISYVANVYAIRYDFESNFLPKGSRSKILLVLILSPIVEELNFRGLYECMIKDQVLSILLPSVAFGLLHYAPFARGPEELRRVAVLASMAMGFLLSLVLKVGGLLPSIFFHSLANLTALLVERRFEKP